MKNDDELKVTIAGDFNADPQWLVADAESANVSCRRETPVDDFIALEDRAGRDLQRRVPHKFLERLFRRERPCPHLFKKSEHVVYDDGLFAGLSAHAPRVVHDNDG